MKKYETSPMELCGIPIIPREFTWWEKIRLFFAKPIVTHDWGAGDDKSVTMVFKKIGNKIYVIEEKTK